MDRVRIIMLVIFSFLFLYSLIFYPLTLLLLSLFYKKNVNKDDNYKISVSLIILACNEEDNIEKKILNSLSLNYPKEKLEIIIASESSDKTNEITSRYIKQGVILDAYNTKLGKVETMRRAVKKATGEIVIFSDSDVIYDKEAVAMIVRNYADKRIGAVCGRLKYLLSDSDHVGILEGVRWSYENFIKRLSSNIFSLDVANGPIFSVRKDYYYPIGYKRGDDQELPVMVLIKGKGSIFENEAIGYEQHIASFKVELYKKVRIVHWMLPSSLVLLYKALKCKRFFIAFQLFSHKINRWLSPFWLIGITISAFFLKNTIYGKLVCMGILIFVGCIFLGYLADRLNSKLLNYFYPFYYFYILNLASFMGVIKILLRHDIPWHSASEDNKQKH